MLDLTDRETMLIAPLAVLVFLLGIYPTPLLQTMEAAIVADSVRLPQSASKPAPTERGR